MCGGGSMDFVGRAKDEIDRTWDNVEDFGKDFGSNLIGAGLGSVGGFLLGGPLGSLVGGTLGYEYGDEIYYSLSGQKYKDEKALGAMGEDLNNLAGQISALQDRLGNKAFLEQIFKYGDIRRIKGLGTDYEQLLRDYEALLADYKKNTDVGFIGGLVLFIPNVLSALVYNILDYIKTGDEASLRAAITIGLLIAAIVLSILALIPSGGKSSVTLAAAIAATLTIISAVLTLDAMVNNSGLLGAAFRILDVVLNKVFQADKYTNSEGFDQDILIKSIPDSINRVWLGYHEKQDGSDATEAWQVRAMDAKEF
jgi:hypothetical protein